MEEHEDEWFDDVVFCGYESGSWTGIFGRLETSYDADRNEWFAAIHASEADAQASLANWRKITTPEPGDL
tara:strand:- start:213 stop:422 length:210 start_codon:yes stop_codon:yes gene_type:complete